MRIHVAPLRALLGAVAADASERYPVAVVIAANVEDAGDRRLLGMKIAELLIGR